MAKFSKQKLTDPNSSSDVRRHTLLNNVRNKCPLITTAIANLVNVSAMTLPSDVVMRDHVAQVQIATTAIKANPAVAAVNSR